MKKTDKTNVELIAEMNDVADQHRNRFGRNPISDLLWEAAGVWEASLPKKPGPKAKPGPKPKVADKPSDGS